MQLYSNSISILIVGRVITSTTKLVLRLKFDLGSIEVNGIKVIEPARAGGDKAKRDRRNISWTGGCIEVK